MTRTQFIQKSMAKTKLTTELHEAIVSAIENGCYTSVAVEAAGLDESTYYKWLKRGEAELDRVEVDSRRSVKKSEEPFVQLFQSVTCARGASEANLVKAVRDASVADWRAATWLLERRFSERWANVQKIEVAVEREMDALFGMLEENLAPEEFRKVAVILAGDKA